MTSSTTSPAPPEDDSNPLLVALQQSQDVKVRVEASAEILGTANQGLRQKHHVGSTENVADSIVVEIEQVKDELHECAVDLRNVNEALVDGAADLQVAEHALMQSQQALAATEAALSAALDDGKRARLEALHDTATGLPNRDHFNSALEQAVAQARRHGLTLAVLFLDLDGFKAINDTHGHAVGDQVLLAVAQRLLSSCRDEDMVCRNGGDEFLYLLMNPNGQENIARIAFAVRSALSRPLPIGDWQFVVESSVGVAVYPEDGVAPDELIRTADAAMYDAKKANAGVRFSANLKTQQRA